MRRLYSLFQNIDLKGVSHSVEAIYKGPHVVNPSFKRIGKPHTILYVRNLHYDLYIIYTSFHHTFTI